MFNRCLTFIFLLVSLIPAWAVTTETLAPGVYHDKYTLSGPIVVHVIRMDLSRPEYKLQLGLSQKKRNYTAKEKVSVISPRYEAAGNHVVAAVNGSYFNVAASDSGISGMLVDSAGYVKLADASREMICINDARTLAIEELANSSAPTLTFADGSTVNINYYMQDRPTNGLACYMTTWGPTTGTSTQGVEVVITNVSYPIKPLKEVSGVVSSIRTGTSSTNNSIPSGGLVLSANGTNATTLLARMTVGDRVYLKTSISKSSFYWSNFALSGNGYLLRAGLPVDTGTTADPQTALGWNSTNLFMVTVDGRSAASIGMSWNTLASFLLNTVGATDAIALDGGGSTTMLINGQGVVNVPSDGSERAVADAVMLVNQPTSSTFPLQDDFTSAGRTLKWDDKLKYSAVSSFSPAAPGGDGYAMTVKTTTSGADSARVGDLGDTNYTVEAQIYCEYRAAIAGNGYERCGIFARDNGNQAFTSTANKGNCYALIYKTDTGQILPCKVIDGIITDFLAPNPIYLTTSDWHKFTIRCYGSRIQYFLDGAVICTVTDTTFERGYCGIGYHSLYSSNGNIHGTRADYFKAFVLTNLAPFAVSDTTNTLEDASVTISPLVNDSDADADTLTIVSVSATNGSAIILGTNIVLTPNTNFNGTATIGYKVSDGRGGTNSAVITVTVNSVNDAPVALNDTTNVLEDVAVTIHPLANDNDVDGDLLTIVSASAMNGNAIISGTDIVLTPDTNFNGTATIGYTISDGHGGTNNAVITVTVNPVNDVPIAVDDTTNTLQGVSVSINPLVNDTDVEGDTLTIVSVSATNGSAIISGTNILLTPDANFNGTATIGYKISDGHGGTNSAAISVIVSGIPGPATLAIHLDAAQYASLSITGSIGSTYRIEFATQIPSSNWTSLTNIFLPTSPYFYLDTGGGTNYLHRFYRAVSVE